MIKISVPFVITVVLVAIGVLIVVLNAIFTIIKSKGPREKAFSIRASCWVWLLFLSMILLVPITPSPYRYCIVLIYLIVLPLFIYRTATKLQLIRHVDELKKESVPEPKQEG